jgi:nitroimidazol reductase NimA-like FMN-containing flavoprotein (pyridoxamine 5'-phosphate oxidase superfamily)
MSVIKLPKMSEKEIEEVINSQDLCRIAFVDDKYPYISPFQYVLFEGNFYFHFTDYGKKKRILTKNPNVCVSIEKFEIDLSSYYFISMQGKLEMVEDYTLRNKIINQMVKSARGKYSKNFLSVHGFEKTKGWDGVIAKDQLIYIFRQIKNPIGLKSI